MDKNSPRIGLKDLIPLYVPDKYTKNITKFQEEGATELWEFYVKPVKVSLSKDSISRI
jgi:hypothetical protein